MTINPNELRRLADEANKKKQASLKKKKLEEKDSEAQSIINDLPATLEAEARKGEISYNLCPVVDDDVARIVVDFCKKQGLEVIWEPGDMAIDISWQSKEKDPCGC